MQLAWKKAIVTLGFVAAIAAVVVLNAGAAGARSAGAETINLREDTRATGIDFVNDGWPDLYFTSSRFGTNNALFINQHDGSFKDVAMDAGVAALNKPGEGVSMGAVWGDYDNDGNEDLFVYKWGYPQLLHNVGNGKFEDVTERAGLRRWMNSNSAVWID